MNLSFSAESSSVEPSGYKSLTVSVDGVNESDILEYFSVDDILRHFNIGDILDAIGADEVKGHFNLIESEE